MDQNEKFERFEPNGDFPPNEPNEAFFPDELLEPENKAKFLSIKALHVPSSPVTMEKLAVFLEEFKPLVEGIQQLSRNDQHAVVGYLQHTKKLLHKEKFSEEVTQLFGKIVGCFNELLTHSTPLDQVGVLNTINELERLIKL